MEGMRGAILFQHVLFSKDVSMFFSKSHQNAPQDMLRYFKYMSSGILAHPHPGGSSHLVR